MATAKGDNVILNSKHLSGATVPQQLPTLGNGDEVQVPFGAADRFTL